MLATKENASKLSIVSVSLLIILKVIASIFTGSISIRADAVHSIIDLSGVIIGFIGIRVSGKPPDERHTFGHGKAENIAGVVIAALIFIAAGAIVYGAIRRLVYGGTVELVTLGISVTAVAIVINVITSGYVMRVARATDSVALDATARDLRADSLSSVAVLIGLILVRLTGLTILDPIVALLVAVLITRTAYLAMKNSFGGLMDTKLPEAEEQAIISCIMEHRSQLVGFHAVRTRTAGSERFIDLHLVMPKNVSVEEAHQVCDHLEQDLKNRVPNPNITIHVEPCDTECDQCLIFNCELRTGETSG